jgi:hypothetical protein
MLNCWKIFCSNLINKGCLSFIKYDRGSELRRKKWLKIIKTYNKMLFKIKW